jgi:Phosphate-induced protein 1 conserved region
MIFTRRLVDLIFLTAAVTVPNIALSQTAPTALPSQHLTEAAAASNGLAELTPGSKANSIHIFPTPDRANALKLSSALGQPLLYHTMGPVMLTANTYVIFWVPPKLQSGAPTALTKSYQDLQIRFMQDYPGHGIDNNNTQYFQTVGGKTNYIGNTGGFVDSYIDTAPYPASGCKDSATPGNCITDAQLRTEILRAMKLKKWTGGSRNIFFVYTAPGEGSCFDATSTSCAYTAYCAYHGAIPPSPLTPVLYANMPYADPKFCMVTGTPSPNNDPAADAAVSVASHELTEAITDPFLNAWYAANGMEIGDLCAWQFGTNTWDGGKANQSWNGNFYELQQEYDNHANNCVPVGP